MAGPWTTARAGLACALLAAPAASGETPEINYMLQCRGCHLADGSGKPGAVPDLRDSVGRFLRVAGGRAYLVQVPGSAQSPLDDAELAQLLNWMIRSFGPGEIAADFVPYDAEEVSRHRATPLADVDAVRAELVRRMGRPGPAGAEE